MIINALIIYLPYRWPAPKDAARLQERCGEPFEAWQDMAETVHALAGFSS